MMEWQDIESAPRDGTPVLLFTSWAWADGDDGAMFVVGQYDERSKQWHFVTPPNYWNGSDGITINAWMPLPPPPKEQPHD